MEPTGRRSQRSNWGQSPANIRGSGSIPLEGSVPNPKGLGSMPLGRVNSDVGRLVVGVMRVDADRNTDARSNEYVPKYP